MRLINADPFDKLIVKVPDFVYDECSFIMGVETVLDMIRTAKTVTPENSIKELGVKTGVRPETETAGSIEE